MFVKCRSAASGERHEHALPILRPLLEGVHELSTDSGAEGGFDHQHSLARRRSRGPDRTAVHGNCGYPLRIEQHLVTPSGRELILGEQFANPYEQ